MVPGLSDGLSGLSKPPGQPDYTGSGDPPPSWLVSPPLVSLTITSRRGDGCLPERTVPRQRPGHHLGSDLAEPPEAASARVSPSSELIRIRASTGAPAGFDHRVQGLGPGLRSPVERPRRHERLRAGSNLDGRAASEADRAARGRRAQLGAGGIGAAMN